MLLQFSLQWQTFLLVDTELKFEQVCSCRLLQQGTLNAGATQIIAQSKSQLLGNHKSELRIWLCASWSPLFHIVMSNHITKNLVSPRASRSCG